jgi:hypothetical protein
MEPLGRAVRWTRDRPPYAVFIGLAFAMIVVLAVMAPLHLHNRANPLPAGAEQFQCAITDVSEPPTQPKAPAKVDDAIGESTLSILVGRGGARRERQSSHLAVDNAGRKVLPRGGTLNTSVTDLVRADGSVLPAAQVKTYATVSRDASYIVVHTCIDPRHPEVIDPGRYTGVVTLDDSRAYGAAVPVKVEIQYPYVEFILLAYLVAALAGLTWARFIRRMHTTPGPHGEPWSHFPVWLAALLVAVPVALAQAVSDRGWYGDLGQYVTLMTTVGATVIAAAPTLYAMAHVSSSGSPNTPDTPNVRDTSDTWDASDTEPREQKGEKAAPAE